MDLCIEENLDLIGWQLIDGKKKPITLEEKTELPYFSNRELCLIDSKGNSRRYNVPSF